MIYFNYLTVLFSLNFKYNTINLHRSVYDEGLNSLPISKNSKVKSLMTRIYNKGPAKPKLCFYWDLDIVLKYLDDLHLSGLL